LEALRGDCDIPPPRSLDRVVIIAAAGRIASSS
jgi:hypothetical protein